MVGGRRLQACRNLNRAVRADFWEDLDDQTAKIVELEENVKRIDLPWRDHVKAIGEIHQIYMKTKEGWTVGRTARSLSISDVQIRKSLIVFKNLDSTLLRDSDGIERSYSILQNAAERRAAQIVNEIAQAGTALFNETFDESPDHVRDGTTDEGTSGTEASSQAPSSSDLPINGDNPTTSTISAIPQIAKKAILNVNFLNWIKTYTGNKFNLIHCDFPYDIKYDSYAKGVKDTSEDYDFSGFFPLLDALTENLDKICSYSAHLVFWFSMKFYERTKTKLESSGLFVHEHPLIWLKSDNSGIVPGRDGAFPRRIYETAFLCSRGKRTLTKSASNAYAAPTADRPIHPSQKPEPVLRHFFSMLVDETTDLLDPTCGSGSALRAAEDCGARSVLGLELNAQYAETAEAQTQTARRLRQAIRG